MVNQKKNNKLGHVHKSSGLSNKIISQIRECTKDEKQCPVCYEKIGKNNYTITKCNHIFCNDCIFRSINENGKCPCCREPLFEFSKIKNFDEEDLNNLLNDNIDDRRFFILTLTDSLCLTLNYIVNNGMFNYLDEEKKNIIQEYFHSDFFETIFRRLIIPKLTQSMVAISSYSYMQLYSWLKKD